ncbi:MAG: PIN domain-containing protein, partial [bacterium]
SGKIYMTEKFLIDTNILVYCYDNLDMDKQGVAANLVNKLQFEKSGYLSTQVLGEFFYATTKGKRKLRSPAEAYDSMVNYYSSWTVLEITPIIVLEAANGVINHKFSFYDSQIWATAKLNQIGCVISEDFSNGAIIEGVRFFNPFNGGRQSL